MYENLFIIDDHMCIEMFRPQTIYLLSQGGLRRPKLTRHDMLRFYDRFLECHFTATSIEYTTRLRVKFYNIYEFILFLKILCFVFKGSLNIPEYRCLLIGRLQYLYTIEHAMENNAYFS